jgi:hypothetical protein
MNSLHIESIYIINMLPNPIIKIYLSICLTIHETFIRGFYFMINESEIKNHCTYINYVAINK